MCLPPITSPPFFRSVTDGAYWLVPINMALSKSSVSGGPRTTRAIRNPLNSHMCGEPPQRQCGHAVLLSRASQSSESLIRQALECAYIQPQVELGGQIEA